MAEVARVGDTETPFVTVPVIVTGSPDVQINGRPVAREGDFTGTFKKKQGRSIVTLTSQLLTPSGEQTVFINGKPIAQIGTPGTNGTKVVTGSENVFIG
jgi:uncharacterized Zn-binding protein involved in type VI secretion